MALKQDVIKVVDATAGRLACRLLGRAAGSDDSGRDVRPPQRVLVIRPGGIGDAVLVVPMLQALRETWPSAELDLLLERRNAGVLHDTGLADKIFLYDRIVRDLPEVMRRKYDVVIDTEQYHRLSAVVALMTRAPRRIGFRTNDRARLFTATVPYDQSLYEVYSFLELAGAATGRVPSWSPERPFFPVSQQALEFTDRVLAELPAATLVAIHPGASIPERRWPTERYARLARMLADHGIVVVILGGPGDVRTAAAMSRAIGPAPHANLAGRCSLIQAAAVVSRMSVYVSADSGVLHLAYGVGTPTVHLFGPGVLSKWGPPGSKFRSVKNPVPCSPCTSYGYTPPCCQGLVCMLGIAPETVYAAVVEQLRSNGPRVAAGAGS